MTSSDYIRYELGDFALKSGVSIPKAHLAYNTYSTKGNPLIIHPTSYSLGIQDVEWLIGSGKTLGTDKYFIVVLALFGNGQSTSPTQHELVTKHLGYDHARLVMGWSMGAGQAFQWATQYPDFMDLVIPYCGAAKTSLHNQVFLEGVKSAVLSAKGAASAGICKGEATPKTQYRNWTSSEQIAGMKALGRVCAGWGFSQPFYRHETYRTASTLGFKDLEDFIVHFWEAWALARDPENMLAMLHTWQAGDVSAQEPYNGSYEAAMKGIKAKTVIMPCRTDLYFPVEDSEIELKHMKPGVGELAVFESIWGHWAGGQSVDDAKFLDQKVREVLASK